MTAPTEAEIREAIAGHYSWRTVSDAFTELGGSLSALYDEDDFRPSEVQALDAAGYNVIAPIEERVREEAIEALVRGALTFAREHPDAPRKPQLIPA